MRLKQVACEPWEEEEEKQMVNVKPVALQAGGSENLYKWTGRESFRDCSSVTQIEAEL